MSDNELSINEISVEYNKIYFEMQELLNRDTPCRGDNGEPCKRGTFCCQGCKFLNEKGCTIKSLWCKLWLCHEAKACASEEFLKAREALKGRARKLPNAYWVYGRYSKSNYIKIVMNIREKEKRVKANGA